jgi:hypothetical protein
MSKINVSLVRVGNGQYMDALHNFDHDILQKIISCVQTRTGYE